MVNQWWMEGGSVVSETSRSLFIRRVRFLISGESECHQTITLLHEQLVRRNIVVIEIVIILVGVIKIEIVCINMYLFTVIIVTGIIIVDIVVGVSIRCGVATVSRASHCSQ